METIIQHFAEEIRSLAEKTIEKIINNPEAGISMLTKPLKETLDELGLAICQEVIQELEEMIFQSPERLKKWTAERVDEKGLATEFGELRYKRRYYRLKHDKGYAYLVDKFLGLKPHQRIDPVVEAEMVVLAAEQSYQKSAEQAVKRLLFSRETVKNKVHMLGDIEKEQDKKTAVQKKVRVLYIEADEDHISLQNGKGKLSKLVYVHEGHKVKEAKRRELKNARYFTGSYSDSADLWLEVVDYIDANYDLDTVDKIFLAGDGAPWIKEGLQWIPKSRYILDRYHLNKYVMRATAHASKHRFKLWEALNEADHEQTDILLRELINKTDDEKRKDRIRETRTYIFTNWLGIHNYVSDIDAIGCSAEGHVSHIFSDRMSSRPMGWSNHGADQMARLRVFKFNGGDKQNIFDYITRKDKEQRKEKMLEKMVSQRPTKTSDTMKYAAPTERIPSFKVGKKTGLFQALKSVAF